MSTLLKPRSAIIPIYQGDDAQDLAELRMGVAIAERQLQQKRELLDSQQNRARRVGDPVAVTSDEIAAAEAEVRAKQDAFDAGVDKAADRALEVRLQSIGRRRFRELVAAHPVRMVTNEDGVSAPDEDDDEFGVNVETFPLALLEYVDPDDPDIRTVAAPEFKGPKDTREFFEDEVADGDVDKIWVAAYSLNRAAATDPKELRYSRSTGATSE